MIITAIRPYNYISKPLTQNKEQKERPNFGYNALPQYSYPIFKSSWTKQSEIAKDIFKERLSKGGKLKNIDIFKLDIDKLEGIQEGIKVFDGMSLREIAFMLTTVSEFATVRGCRNNCAHCYANAKPPIKENDEHINKMSWEDFTNLTGGIKELNRRLGFKISGELAINSERYLTPFHDSDGTDIALKDKYGREHDFAEIAEELYDAMGVSVVFDTSGWNLSDKKAQERAEKFIEYQKNSRSTNSIQQINISLNPFHSLYKTSVDLKEKGDIEKSEKLRDLYTSRMANAIYTFTPVIKNDKFSLLKTAIRKGEIFENFNQNSLDELFEEIITKVRRMYKKDLEKEQKYISSQKEIESNIKMLRNKYYQSPPRIITYTGKTKKNFGVDSNLIPDYFQGTTNNIEEYKYYDSIGEYRYYHVGIVDSNGDYYLTDYDKIIPTELKLNLSNKNKSTANIEPLSNGFLLTKEKINKLEID